MGFHCFLQQPTSSFCILKNLQEAFALLIYNESEKAYVQFLYWMTVINVLLWFFEVV
jgi:hypothetical protein